MNPTKNWYKNIKTIFYKKITDALDQLSNVNERILLKKFPIVLGGEHSLTAGSIKPFLKDIMKLYCYILMPMLIYVKVTMVKNFLHPL